MTWGEQDCDEMFTQKDMFMAYLAGYTAAKAMYTNEKLPKSAYRRTSFRAWLKDQWPNLHILFNEDDMEMWLEEFLHL